MGGPGSGSGSSAAPLPLLLFEAAEAIVEVPLSSATASTQSARSGLLESSRGSIDA